MIAIVCLDPAKGMLFNHRRQSRDKKVTEKICEICQGKRVWMNQYSSTLYGNLEGVKVEVCKDFLVKSADEDLCFVETENLEPVKKKIDELIVFRWNRKYPADVYLDLDLSKWKKLKSEELQGTSHAKINVEYYRKKSKSDISNLSLSPFLETSEQTKINKEPYILEKGKQTELKKEFCSKLDSKKRSQGACVKIECNLMPKQKRKPNRKNKPSGWHNVKYDIVNGKYLYNRCHLIGYQLTGNNAIENLITGTRYMNEKGMLPFENMVADYVKETKHQVLYEANPVFEGNNKVANGVRLEAYSIEDKGDGICFNVFVPNIQPCIDIDYATGESRLGYDSSPKNGEKEIRGNSKSKIYYCPGHKTYEKLSISKYLVTFPSEEIAIEVGYRKVKDGT